MANENSSSALEDIKVNEPAFEGLQSAAEKTEGQQMNVTDSSKTLAELVYNVADALEGIMEKNPNLEGAKEWLDLLNKLRATAEQILDSVESLSPTEYAMTLVRRIDQDLLAVVPETTEHPENKEAFDRVRQLMQTIASNGEINDLSPELVVSRIGEALQREIDGTDSIDDDEKGTLVSEELVEAMTKLVEDHSKMVGTTAVLLNTTKEDLAVHLQPELEKLEKLMELRRQAREGSKRVPFRRRAEIREELENSPEFQGKHKQVAVQLSKHADRMSAEAREEASDAHLQVDRELDEAVEKKIAKEWQELNPGKENFDLVAITEAIQIVQKRIQLLADRIRTALAMASGVEQADSYMPAELADGVTDETDREKILNAALGLAIEDTRDALRAVTKGVVNLSTDELLGALEKYNFTSAFLNGSDNQGGGDAGNTGGGAPEASAPEPEQPAPEPEPSAPEKPEAAPEQAPVSDAAPEAAPAAPAEPEDGDSKKAEDKKEEEEEEEEEEEDDDKKKPGDAPQA